MAGFDNISIVIGKHDDNLIVTFLPTPSKEIKDPAVSSISPLSMQGTPDELDEGFFLAIEKPVSATRELFSNISDYEASVEEARKNSDMERKKKEEDRKAREAEKKERQENDKTVREAITASETSRNTDPETAFLALKALEKKNLKVSPEVKLNLDAAMADLKTVLKQTSLF